MTGAGEPMAAARAGGSPRASWVMLLALTTGFSLSQAYRTVAAMMATQLQHEFGLTPQQLGVFAATFHFSFGALQLLMGIGIDLHGVRRTVLAAFPLTMAGALVSATQGMALPGLNHRFPVTAGVLEEACGELMRRFFRERRV